jgi:hypothetical protein
MPSGIASNQKEKIVSTPFVQAAFSWLLDQHEIAISPERVQVTKLAPDHYLVQYVSDGCSFTGEYQGTEYAGIIKLYSVTTPAWRTVEFNTEDYIRGEGGVPVPCSRARLSVAMN